ncbi:MAG: right-handed parallel beta-helix repeat-containing protein [Verrucomicrobiaceae bacterium]|nr:right-handed parallel beta-helix repeat-containing protein [Verrucomicrobiaceae bacterium]
MKKLVLLSLLALPTGLLAEGAPPRQTSGDTVVQPNWKQRLTIKVGPGEDADIRGSTDRTLQAGVDYVVRFGGGTVQILPGTYRLRNAVFLASHVRLVGAGEKTVIIKDPSATTTLAADSDWFDQEITLANDKEFRIGDGVCLRTKDPKTGVQQVIKRTLVARTGNRFKLDKALRENVWRLNNGTVSTLFPLLSGEFIEDVVIEDLVLDGNREHNDELDGNYAGCIFLQDCKDITIRRIHAKNNHGDGISWQICHDVTVEKCISEGHSGLGLHPGSGSQRPVMRDNVLRDNNIGLFFCWGVKNGVAERNQIEGNKVGVSIGHHDTDNIVRRNTITNSREAGVLFRPERGADFAGHRNRIEANTLTNNGPETGAAIDIQGGTEGIRIIGNTIEDKRGTAKRVAVRQGAETKDIEVKGNTIRGFATELEKKSPANPPSTP